MTTFYLLRHGTRASHNEDTLLSEIGLQQAQKTAKYLVGQNVAAIYASPLARTQQTARVISELLSLPITTDERLLERMVYDATKSASWDDFIMEWGNTMADREYQPPYGDSAINAGNRIASLLDEISNDKVNVVVAHGGVIGDFLRNTFPEKMFSFETNPPTAQNWLKIDECSISEVAREGNEYTLKRVNDTTHLS